MGLRDALRGAFGVSEERDAPWPSLSLNDWAEMVSYQGTTYPIVNQTLSLPHEEITDTYTGMVSGAYKKNGVVFACMLSRLLLFSEARFQFQRMRGGRPQDLFGTPALNILETPWPNGTTGDLLARAIQDVDLEGNFYAYQEGGQLYRMRPDWVSIVIGSDTDDEMAAYQADAEILGYVYYPGGRGNTGNMRVFRREEVAHWAPVPDPGAHFRGMSWLTPVLGEILADGAATTHKLKFFENGATPSMVVTMQDLDSDEFLKFARLFEDAKTGVRNAYKTLFFTRANDVKIVGADLKQTDFKVTQGAGETRIAAAAGVPPIIVGLSEGLASATYSNYGQARRRFADGTMRPLWRSFAAAMSTLIQVPTGTRLWYDDRDIMFLQEDRQDAANIQSTEASTIHTLISTGYESNSVVAAVLTGDWSALTHTGLFSVQLQPAGSISEGKGSVVQGVPVQLGKGGKQTPVAPPPKVPALPPAKSPRAMLAPWLDEFPDDERVTGEIIEPEPVLVGAHPTVEVHIHEAPITVEAARAPDVHQDNHYTLEHTIDARTTVEPAPPANVEVDARTTVEVPEPKPVKRTVKVDRDETGRTTGYEVSDGDE